MPREIATRMLCDARDFTMKRSTGVVSRTKELIRDVI